MFSLNDDGMYDLMDIWNEKLKKRGTEPENRGCEENKENRDIYYEVEIEDERTERMPHNQLKQRTSVQQTQMALEDAQSALPETPPILDISELWFEDKDVIQQKQQEYAQQLVDYTKKQILTELSPLLETASQNTKNNDDSSNKSIPKGRKATRTIFHSVKQTSINTITKVFIIITLIAIIAQLCWVPHRLYTVTVSSQGVPHETFDRIQYSWITRSFAVMDWKSRPEYTSKIAYDIIAIHILITLVISMITYFIIKWLIKHLRRNIL